MQSEHRNRPLKRQTQKLACLRAFVQEGVPVSLPPVRGVPAIGSTYKGSSTGCTACCKLV